MSTVTHAPAAPRSGALKRFFTAREIPVASALVVLIVVTYIINPRFLSPQSSKDLMLNATIVVILAVAQALVIITRNVDLSVGAILGLVAFGTGTVFDIFPNIPIVLVFVIGMVFGGLLGSINGMLVTSAKVPALVITLGTLYIFRGVLSSWAGSQQYFSGDNPKEFGNLSVDTFLSIPIITIIAVVITVAVAMFMSFVRSGRDLYAIGSDPEAARLFGIPVGGRVLSAFIACGALTGLAGVLYTSRYNSVGALTGSGIELDVVAAVVVGGVAIFGGSGTVAGAAIGAVLLATITGALTATRVDKFWQQAIVGVLILAAIIIDRVVSLRRARKLRVDEAKDV
ncbi:putative L-rhamnose ABC transporter, transmembrane component 2 [Leifsonia rubra CMS 76R]|nr:putative L-rhamnose ABC transporter, transmembrane component 2 [Leifsonia rubra CMS 76R]